MLSRERCPKDTSNRNHIRAAWLLWTLLLVLRSGGSNPLRLEASPGEESTRTTDPAQAKTAKIVFQGKFHCSLVRQVIMPFQGTIREFKVRCGQPVKEGDILARYELAKESILQIRRRVTHGQISELEMRLAEVEKNLVTIGSKRREMRQLTGEHLAPAQSLDQIEQESQFLEKERTAILDRIRQERGLANDDMALLKHQLAMQIEAGRIPAVVPLLAPISGHIILVHPDLKEGAELPAGTPAFAVGVMDPMIMKAQVHEIEAMRLSLGDRADILLESMPDLKNVGTISRISWTPKTPGPEQPSFYEIELTVSNPQLAIRDGLKGEATIQKSK